MKRVLIVLALFGRLFAQTLNIPECAEHSVYLSNTPTTIAMSGSGAAARCTAGTVPFGNAGSVTYNCPVNTGAGMTIWGFDIQSACKTSSVAFAVQSVDTVGHHYDLGLYYIKGPQTYQQWFGQLVVHTGVLPRLGSSQGLQAQGWQGTSTCSVPCTLPPGQYALALATDCSSGCAALYGDDAKGFMYLFNVWFGGNAGTGANPALLAAGCAPGFPPSQCTLQISSGLPASVGAPSIPVLTDPTLGYTGCTNGCPKPPAVLIF